MKYNVGDKVQIKDIDWYNKNKDENGRVDAGFFLNYDMSRWCGKIMTILTVYETYYRMDADYFSQFFWTDEMIECKVEE